MPGTLRPAEENVKGTCRWCGYEYPAGTLEQVIEAADYHRRNMCTLPYRRQARSAYY